MTVDEVNLLNEKAKSKKDGVYSFRGNLWVVKENKFLAYCKYNGEVLQRFGVFDTGIGDFSTLYLSDRKKKLFEWLKSQ
jgi:hypothetical protein